MSPAGSRAPPDARTPTRCAASSRRRGKPPRACEEGDFLSQDPKRGPGAIHVWHGACSGSPEPETGKTLRGDSTMNRWILPLALALLLVAGLPADEKDRPASKGKEADVKLPTSDRDFVPRAISCSVAQTKYAELAE